MSLAVNSLLEISRTPNSLILLATGRPPRIVERGARYFRDSFFSIGVGIESGVVRVDAVAE